MSRLFSFLKNPYLQGFIFGLSITSISLWEIRTILNLTTNDQGLILGNLVSFLLLLISLSLFIPYLIKNKDSIKTWKFSQTVLLSGTLLLFTNWSYASFSFLPDSHIAFSSLILAGVLTLVRKYNANGIINWTHLSILFSAWLFTSFLYSSNFSPLFTDDHGAVLYRLQLLKDNFPNIPVYNSEWNAGWDWRDFFATGILNIFFIFSPFIYALSVPTAYTIIVPTVLFILLPLSTFIGSKLLGARRDASAISAFLAMSSSAIWYKWGFSYGSMGFVCSTALIPLAFSLLISSVHKGENNSWLKIILSITVITLSIFWSAQGITLIPFILYCLYKIKLFLFNKKLLVLALGLVLINGPWIYTFLNVSKVTSFVQPSGNKAVKVIGQREDSEQSPAANIRAGKIKLNYKDLIKHLRDFNIKLNPIILFFSIPALFLCYLDKFYKNAFLATSCFLALVGLIGPSFKPQLELERLLIVMSILLCIPIGCFLSSFIQKQREGNIYKQTVSTFCLSALMLTSAISTLNQVQNKTYNTYKTIPDDLYLIAKIIRNNHGSGRTLFSGFVLHELGGGHIAPLTTLSESPIIASSPVHNLWWYTDVIPEDFRDRSVQGIEEYLDLMNVSLVVAHEKNWRHLFRQSPWQYQELETVGKFTFFTRKTYPNSYLLQGEGSLLEQNSNHIKFDVRSTSAVLRFNHFSFLEVLGCKEILPFKIGANINFIELKECTPGEVTIRSVPVYKRVLQ